MCLRESVKEREGVSILNLADIPSFRKDGDTAWQSRKRMSTEDGTVCLRLNYCTCLTQK